VCGSSVNNRGKDTAFIIGTNVALHNLLGREFPFSRRTADSPTRRTYQTVFRVLTRENLARLDGERRSSPGLTRFMSQVGQFNVKTGPRAPARVVLAAPESRRRPLVRRTSRRDAFRNRARPRRADADKSAHALWRAAETSRVRTRGTTGGSPRASLRSPPGRLRLR
jgi:hypothetical protein